MNRNEISIASENTKAKFMHDWQSLIVDKYTNHRYGIRNSHMHGTTPKSTIIELPRWGPGSDRRESIRHGRDAIDESRIAMSGWAPAPNRIIKQNAKFPLKQ